MKLNKLLTPILGLATVSTVVAPIATSCTSETVAHVKVSPKSEEVTSNGGKATYLLVLDRNDYDQHGFRVTTTVSKDDKTGVVSDDFECTWEIDGDHLTVYVEYTGEEDPTTETIVKLNLNVYYGTEWSQTLGVKFIYEAVGDFELQWVQSSEYLDYPHFAIENINLQLGRTYEFTCDLTKASDEYNYYDYFDPLDDEVAYFETYEVWVDGVQMTEGDDDDYKDYILDYDASGNACYIDFYDARSSMQTGNKLKIVGKNCLVAGKNSFYLYEGW